jgi:creatinine amidohydrolase
MTKVETPAQIELELLSGTQLNSESIVFLPLGSHEFHGSHCPLGTDSIIASELAKGVAHKIPNSFVLPVVSYTYSILHDRYPGTVTVAAQTLISLLEDILCSLARQDIRRVVIVNGHDGNVPCIDIAATNARRKYPSCVIVTTTWWQVSKQNEEIGKLFGKYGGKGHGGAEEVALVLAAGRGQASTDAEHAEILTVQNRTAAPFLRHDIAIVFQDMTEITGKGYEGTPSEATAEKGQYIYDYLIGQYVDFIGLIDWSLGGYQPPAGR